MKNRTWFATVEQHYDLLVSEGDDPVRDPPKLKRYMDRYDGRAFFEQLGEIAGLRVLEIGVGTGRLATQVLRRNPSLLVAIDISEQALDRCRLNAENASNLRLERAMFPDWITNYLFDVIYSSQTFLHISDLETSLLAIRKLLTRNGRAVISFANCEKSL